VSSRSPTTEDSGRKPKGELPYFATAAKGTEGLLREELRDLGIYPIRGDRGGVHFGRGIADAFRVCLWSRIAVRVLERRGSMAVHSDDSLYAAVRELDVTDLLDPDRTLAVSATVRSSDMTHSQFVARRVKDAIVDVQRERFGRRSDVNAEDPDVAFFVHLANNQMTLYVDLVGEPLGRRGYRVSGGPAPLKETLAASLLRLAGYDGSTPLFDPCCGAGTILLEAAQIALGRAPGLVRPSFKLERFVRVSEPEKTLFAELRARAKAEEKSELVAPIAGSDIDLDSLDRVRMGSARLGIELPVMRRDILQLAPPSPPGLVVTNPPYGVRMDGGESLDRRMGAALSRWHGYRIVLLTAGREILTGMGHRPAFEHTLFNGDIECRAFGWEIPEVSEISEA
jgi:23S rRNA G2445 N2-methylase RlmL